MDLLTKGTIIFVSISFLPVTLYFLKVIFTKKMNEYQKEEVNLLKEQSYVKDMMLKQQIKEIYLKERKPFYDEARTLFNMLMKEAKLSHEQIMYLRKLLENALGDKVHDYDDFTHAIKRKGETIRVKGFQNDAHRIYTYMKSYSIDVGDWKKIIDFLKECAEVAHTG